MRRPRGHPPRHRAAIGEHHPEAPARRDLCRAPPGDAPRRIAARRAAPGGPGAKRFALRSHPHRTRTPLSRPATLSRRRSAPAPRATHPRGCPPPPRLRARNAKAAVRARLEEASPRAVTHLERVGGKGARVVWPATRSTRIRRRWRSAAACHCMRRTPHFQGGNREGSAPRTVVCLQQGGASRIRNTVVLFGMARGIGEDPRRSPASHLEQVEYPVSREELV